MNASGTAVDFGGLAFAIASNLQISSYVPPYLDFCEGVTITSFNCASASGSYINFGDFNANRSSQASSQMLVATNAANGYVIQVAGTTMTSGNNIVNALTTDTSSHPGTSQFGINLRANNFPLIGADPSGPGLGYAASGYNNPDNFKFISDDVVASSPVADDYRRYTVSYLVNIPSDQPVGVYDSTLTYVCAGSF